ncbi:hypothetical protein PPERSA_01443 [Pseudocohnilembus persalinus]|uniref:Transmembrane protein n=1 Tax=Pseudocohnilembus persalinus TaxID=266149 RepID=A0A0V0QH83_PSEPJ|nr:hypothetical protein PPERSA_01443 [Pseudocohnilembus persalinus]|eukprot:KRX01540.1 hypothetical protein PPERSA_01443 [Pseudocohnilembus persalinus]
MNKNFSILSVIIILACLYLSQQSVSFFEVGDCLVQNCNARFDKDCMAYDECKEYTAFINSQIQGDITNQNCKEYKKGYDQAGADGEMSQENYLACLQFGYDQLINNLDQDGEDGEENNEALVVVNQIVQCNCLCVENLTLEKSANSQCDYADLSPFITDKNDKNSNKQQKNNERIEEL